MRRYSIYFIQHFSQFKALKTLCFYSAVLIIMMFSFKPSGTTPWTFLRMVTKAHPTEKAFGHEFAAFKKHLPEQGTVFMLTDHPFGSTKSESELRHTAQGHFAPLKIANSPGPIPGFVYCSDTANATRRLRETGYRLLLSLSDGKGIIVKEK